MIVTCIFKWNLPLLLLFVDICGCICCFIVAANITEYPALQLVTSPSTATFTCTASGLPRPTITWMDPDNNPLMNGGDISIASMEVGNRDIMSTLQVMKTSASVSGTYTCSTDNSIIGRSDITSISTTLTVHGEIN